jgi:histidinol-phosphatase (PHP family)
LKTTYESQIRLPIGFESEWIRPSSLGLIQTLQKKNQYDFFVGSVHHVHTIPIDFDRPLYEKARNKSGGSDEKLFEDYFDAQYDMLQALEPPVVGHFDLIRLFSENPEQSFKEWKGVWSRVLRNLEFVANYGGILELNSSALRKGMSEPYPKVEICKVCEKSTVSRTNLTLSE